MVHQPIADQAYQLLRNGLFEKAEHCFSFLTIMHPGDIHGWLGLGMAYYMQNKCTQALQAFDIAHRLDPTWCEPQAWKIETLLREGKKSEAQNLLNHANQMECRTSSEIEHLQKLKEFCCGGIQ